MPLPQRTLQQARSFQERLAQQTPTRGEESAEKRLWKMGGNANSRPERARTPPLPHAGHVHALRKLAHPCLPFLEGQKRRERPEDGRFRFEADARSHPKRKTAPLSLLVPARTSVRLQESDGRRSPAGLSVLLHTYRLRK